MNFLKLVVIVGVGIYVGQVFAVESQMAFHQNCYPVSSECIDIPFPSDASERILVKKNPEMTISPNDIVRAEFSKDEFGLDQLFLHLEKSAGDKFAQVTENSIGKKLVVVVNDKAIFAPEIQQAITGGNVSLKSGFGKGYEYLKDLPWLKAMAEEGTASRESWSLFSLVSFIVLGILILGGSIFFAFFSKKSSEEVSL